MLTHSIYRAKWNIYPKLGIVPTAPLHLDIEVTNKCNLKCIMCTNGIKRPEETGFIDFNFAKDLIYQATIMGVYSIKFNWRGEPTLYPKLGELADYAKQVGIHEVQMNTNGQFNGNKIGGYGNFDRIIFSLDGVTPQTYEKIRVGGRADLIMDNISLLSTRKNSIRVQMCKLKENEHEWELFKDFGNYYGLDYRLYEATERGSGHGEKNFKRIKCPQPYQRMVISYDGKVMPCCSDWDGDMIVGDAKKNTLQSIWGSYTFKEIREKAKHKDYRNKPCKNCMAIDSYDYRPI